MEWMSNKYGTGESILCSDYMAYILLKNNRASDHVDRKTHGINKK